MVFKNIFLKNQKRVESSTSKTEKSTKTFKGLTANEPKELGFGTSITDTVRLINLDGSFNVKRKGRTSFHPYQALSLMSWKKFNLLVLSSFVLVNLLFTCFYMGMGDRQFNGIDPTLKVWEKFSEMFFFSCQTFTSLGYGRVNPAGFESGIISSLEALIGLLALAFATGLLFARFSRPNTDLAYSKNALIAPFKDGKALMYKFANRRSNQLIELEVQVSFSAIITEDGKNVRKFYSLPLEVSKVNFFPTTWTIVHAITNESPINNYNSLQELKDAGAEILIMVKAFDDTFSQVVYNRFSYIANEIVWGAKFVSNFFPQDGTIVLDMDKMDDYVVTEI